MNVAVTGSRIWDDEHLLCMMLDQYAFGGSHLHVGDARGADRIAREWADRAGVQCTMYVAPWATRGKAAGMIRNREMLDEGHVQLLLAFKLGRESAGTDGCIREAGYRKIPVIVVQKLNG